MTRPIMGSPPHVGLSDAASFGQNRSPVSYSAPHCGQTLATVTCSSASGVGCRARSPDPMLVCRLDPSGGDLRPVSAESALPPAIRDCGFGWSLLGIARGDVFASGVPAGPIPHGPNAHSKGLRYKESDWWGSHPPALSPIPEE